MKVSEIFEKEPQQWGFRGDPHLWRELKSQFRDIDMPREPEQLKIIIENEYQNCTGLPITHSESFCVDRFKKSGMSSGAISPSFWVNTAVPLLVGRHQKS